jgi:NADH pyrophosphatase NudC (nudix superfamily)
MIGRWLCKLCSVCQSCKTTQAPRWSHVIVPDEEEVRFLATFCEQCHKQFEEDQFCPICVRVYRPDSDELAMVCCDQCERYLYLIQMDSCWM